ncbi:acyl-CoA N-acyltransferase [Nemania sp. FL0031]|nr:acyl-CoA N-acyltransferase [Nemania sp. FL0031]
MPLLRPATPADVPRMVDIILTAMPHSLQWEYRFPYKKEFSEDHHKYTTMLYEQFVDSKNVDWNPYVIELTSDDDAGVVEVTKPDEGNTLRQDSTPYKEAIVAVAIWDVSYINKRKDASYEPFSPPAYVVEHGGRNRRDCNPEHQAAFQRNGKQTKQILSKYGINQIHLQILATHPDHWRRGYGKMLCEWGMRKASQEGLVVSLSASEVGKNLYERLGFKNMGTVTDKAPGEKETVSSTVFVYNPKEQTDVSHEDL